MLAIITAASALTLHVRPSLRADVRMGTGDVDDACDGDEASCMRLGSDELPDCVDASSGRIPLALAQHRRRSQRLT